MTSAEIGPGVRRFIEMRARGERPDVPALASRYPKEALDLVEAARRAAVQDESRARELMWFARAEVLRDAGQDSSIGAALRRARRERKLSITLLSSALRERGVELLPIAIDHLEENRVTIKNVDPEVWSAVIEELQIDRHLVVAGIQMALDAPSTSPSFTRMDRRASTSDREEFLAEATASPPDEGAAEYLERVRQALGLPSALDDTPQ